MLKKFTGSSLFRSAGSYTLSNIINSAIPFLLMPVLTRYLTPTDYGIIAMFQVLIGFIAPFVGINVQGAVSVKYFKKDEIDFPRYVSSCFLILLSSCFLMIIVFVAGYAQISQMTEIPVDWLWTVIVLCLGQFAIAILLVILQSSIQPVTYGIIQIAQSVMNLVLTLCMVVWLKYNWEGRIIAQVLTASIFAIFSLVTLYRRGWLVFDYDKAYIKDALKFGIPLIPHAIAGFAMAMSDRIIITRLIGLADAGIYSVASAVSMTISIMQNSFNQAYVPWLFEKLRTGGPNVRKKIVSFTYCYMIGLLVITLLFSFCMPVFFKIFIDSKFFSAANLVIWIALGYAFNGMYKMVVNFIFYVEKTDVLAVITFVTSLFHVAITYLMVSKFGITGAAQATTITHFATFLVVWGVSNLLYPMPWLESIRKK